MTKYLTINSFAYVFSLVHKNTKNGKHRHHYNFPLSCFPLGTTPVFGSEEKKVEEWCSLMAVATSRSRSRIWTIFVTV